MGVDVIKCTSCKMRYNASVYSTCPFCKKGVGNDSNSKKDTSLSSNNEKQSRLFPWRFGNDNKEKPSEKINPIMETEDETLLSPFAPKPNSTEELIKEMEEIVDNRDNKSSQYNAGKDGIRTSNGSKTMSIWEIKKSESKLVEPLSIGNDKEEIYDDLSSIELDNQTPEERLPVEPVQVQERPVQQQTQQQTQQTGSVTSRIQGISKTTAKYISVSGGEVSYPAVGWLVCVKGVYYGQSFPLRAGRNHIGRASEMEIALIRDNSVSSKNVVSIIYDSKSNAFNALPGESSSLCYVNGEALYERLRLTGFEEIELGDSEKNKFVFVPFCGEKFQWSMYENNDD